MVDLLSWTSPISVERQLEHDLVDFNDLLQQDKEEEDMEN
jgi:hypothetical protein